MRVLAMTAAVLLLSTQPVVAGEYRYIAKVNGEQEVEYDRGRGTTWSNAPNSEVKLTHAGTFASKRISLALRVWKFTGKTLDMDIKDVTATYGDAPLHVYTAPELRKIVRGRSGWAKVANGVLTGVAAGLSSSRSTIRSSGRVGSTTYSSETTVYTPNYEAQNEAFRRGGDTSDEIDRYRDARLNDIESLVLQRTTIKEDDDEYLWLVVVDKPKKIDSSQLKISVKVGEEVHVFEYDIIEE